MNTKPTTTNHIPTTADRIQLLSDFITYTMNRQAVHFKPDLISVKTGEPEREILKCRAIATDKKCRIAICTPDNKWSYIIPGTDYADIILNELQLAVRNLHYSKKLSQ